MTTPKVQLEEMFPWELAQALAEAPICYLPLGAIEWHGEHNAVGLDALKAHAVCVRAAQQSGGVVAPALYWATDSREDLEDGTYLTGGVEHGERYHVPGNMFWLRPNTYHALLLDIYETMRRRGFRAIVVVAGHWSGHTLPTVRASGADFLAQHPAMRWLLVTDQEVVPDMHYPHEHAAGGETSLLMHIRPDLVDLSKTFETDGVLRSYYAGQPAHLRRRRETSYKYIGVLTCSFMWKTGADDGSNDPETTASPERGAQLMAVIAERIAARAQALLGDAPTACQS
ncbi:MAG: creatininase family protein [Chloroflexi bacterium]|nr:creatininase family protein [Chloroflexota bacterium]MBU1748645.1 creatininase family protein [Chloroflexota bacterium]